MYDFNFLRVLGFVLCFPGSSAVKNLNANAGDQGLIPGSRRSPEEGKGSPLQCSCLENPMDRGAWWATVHGFTKSQTGLSTHIHVVWLLRIGFILKSAPCVPGRLCILGAVFQKCQFVSSFCVVTYFPTSSINFFFKKEYCNLELTVDFILSVLSFGFMCFETLLMGKILCEFYVTLMNWLLYHYEMPLVIASNISCFETCFD